MFIKGSLHIAAAHHVVHASAMLNYIAHRSLRRMHGELWRMISRLRSFRPGHETYLRRV